MDGVGFPSSRAAAAMGAMRTASHSLAAGWVTERFESLAESFREFTADDVAELDHGCVTDLVDRAVAFRTAGDDALSAQLRQIP